jgi:starch phosphorylase
MENVNNTLQDKEKIKESIRSKLMSFYGTTVEEATKVQLYRVVALSVRDVLMEKWVNSNKASKNSKDKKLYYLSIEFLIGRLLKENMMNIFSVDIYKEACADLGIDIEELAGIEREAGLGNGGLGRLAACILDSMTTAKLPVVGCGIRYQYGLFKQNIMNGYQVETPDPWLQDGGNIWELIRPEQQEEIRFGGVLDQKWIDGKLTVHYHDYDTVYAVPYDIPVVGYGSSHINTLRLWRAKSSDELNMEWFNKGDYVKAIEEKEKDENISRVLYPDDVHYQGKALRLKQYYFFVSATIQNIVHTFKKEYADFKIFPEKVAIHINDTHPAVAIPELMRVLLDQEGLEWDAAWEITKNSFAYTNHTIMHEALERWSVPLFKELLPRIYAIIHEINERYCRKLWQFYPGERDRISRMAIIAYDEVRMANLCIEGSFSVNGVSALHTRILKEDIFRDFNRVHPEKFHSITNGVTHRRWLFYSNPGLSSLVSEAIGDGWILNPSELKNLQKYADDTSFKNAFGKVKAKAKGKLADYIFKTKGIKVDTSSMFDVQVKRIHEYKRQLLNLLHIMYLYNSAIDNPGYQTHPRTFVFAGKAAPGYRMAKLIIKLIHSVADRINNDPRMHDLLKVVFLEDYRVSVAELIMPAAEVSEQISTAGKEASGTGNMKLMLNGAVTIGTWDGANIEMHDAVGGENIFLFGLKAEEIYKMHHQGDGYNPRQFYEQSKELKKVLDQLLNGIYAKESPMLFADIFYSLVTGDPYMVLADFESYRLKQHKVDLEYMNKGSWWGKAINNVACAGHFSSDRTVAEYNNLIWKLKAKDQI